MPKIRQLLNKPLVEAIVELQWHVSPDQGDPHYTLFPGRLYDRVASLYPFHEPLPASIIPQPVIQNIVQHRFRSKENSWPLIQVGPGIVTFNDTEGYTWENFGQQAKELVQNVFQTYPKPEELRITSLLLRYIDAVELGNVRSDVFHFLEDKLKTKIVLPSELFDNVPVDKVPTGFNFRADFAATNPKGSIAVRFATGTRQDKPSLIWETAVHSRGADIPEMPDGFGDWVEAAHRLTDDWFFKLIEGELERGFVGGR